MAARNKRIEKLNAQYRESQQAGSRGRSVTHHQNNPQGNVSSVEDLEYLKSMGADIEFVKAGNDG